LLGMAHAPTACASAAQAPCCWFAWLLFMSGLTLLFSLFSMFVCVCAKRLGANA
jgi:hypothetical protein